jgi:hypothetical protein
MGDVRTRFQIALGDWSGDGHGVHETCMASAAADLDAVREAYFRTMELLPEDLHPEAICSEYEQTTVSRDVARRVLQLSGIRLDSDDNDDGFVDEKVYVTPEALLDYLIWFINHGDPAVDVRLERDNADTFHFYGHDAKDRHIGFIGYGLFGA